MFSKFVCFPIFLHSILWKIPIHQSLQNLDSLKSKALWKREIWVQFPFWVKFGVFSLSPPSLSLSHVVFDHNFNFKEYLFIHVPWNSFTPNLVLSLVYVDCFLSSSCFNSELETFLNRFLEGSIIGTAKFCFSSVWKASFISRFASFWERH